MKENKVPEKIYHKPLLMEDGESVVRRCTLERTRDDEIEYTRTDAFIEKACEFLQSYRQETYDGKGYITGIVNDETIEEFKKYMKGE